MSDRKQDVYSLIKQLIPVQLSLFLCVFSYCSLSSMQNMGKHGLVLFSVKARQFSFAVCEIAAPIP